MDVPAITALSAVTFVIVVYFLLSRLTAQSSSWPKTKQLLAYTRKVIPKKRKFQLNHNSLDDFVPAGEVTTVHDVAQLFTRRGNEFSVYSVDWDQEVVVLIRPVDGADLKAHPFFREAQRRNAAEVLCVPLERLQEVASAVADKVAHVKEVFIFNTARCGTTLVTRVVEATSVAQSVSEADVFSVISVARHRLQRSSQQGQTPPRHGFSTVLSNEQSTTTLVRNVVTLLNYNLVTSDPRHRDVIFYKFRPDVILLADLLARAFPSAKTVFMYRNGLEVIESICRNNLEGSRGIYVALTWLLMMNIDVYPNPDYIRCFGDDPKYSAVRHRGTLWFHLCARWAEAMQRAVSLQRNQPGYFFHAVIYYPALLNDKKETFRLLMRRLGLKWSPEDPGEDTDKIERALTKDSQAGTVMSSAKGRRHGENWTPDVSPRWMGQWEREYFEEVCRHAGNEIPGPDFLLPGTIL
ncbi:uncharacterized protein LOC118419362 [Branchiostoma floridae]|uniref:Uncharacterized protein LOC118419362 n=1 Tax=Branchiostoma floridae TaxID=7739 RepID=A0A9J7MWR6_BRAFL|nr:uncharacterized protein LOC118419362 [Branchiostoma floridae]